MKRVSSDQYPKYMQMFAPNNWELSCMAVLDHKVPGAIWTNDLNAPSAAFMSTPEGYILAGEPDAAFIDTMKNWFQSIFIPFALEKNYFEFEIYLLTDCEPAANEIFAARNLLKYKRKHYLINITDWHKKKLILPDGYSLINLDYDFIDCNPDLQNMAHIKSWIRNNWGTMENFDNYAFAKAIIKDNVIVSWSVCNCIYQNKCEIGIHTDPAYQCQGMASLTVSAMLEYAFEHNIDQVGWHCAATNTASWKTAEKAGFVLNKHYFGYYAYFKEIRHNQ